MKRQSLREIKVETMMLAGESILAFKIRSFLEVLASVPYGRMF